MSKSHHAQSTRKNSVRKLPFCHVHILGTQCFYIIIKPYESTVSIIQQYNLAKLKKKKEQLYSSNF